MPLSCQRLQPLLSSFNEDARILYSCLNPVTDRDNFQFLGFSTPNFETIFGTLLRFIRCTCKYLPVSASAPQRLVFSYFVLNRGKAH